VFDALLSVRPYKRAWTIDEALDKVKSESGHHFEPACVTALLDVLPECIALRNRYGDG
jgi:putative two-component system response regulator